LDVVLASSNAGKIKELQDMLADLGVVVIPQQTLSIPDIEETGLCFVENAILKARNAALLSGKPAIADDSGLEVDLLDGRPGIYSARYAGEEATDSTNNQKLLDELGDSPLALVSICAMPMIRRRLSVRAAGKVISLLNHAVVKALVTTRCFISKITIATPQR
jgi:non-canonical purine NTP pyrophosphatase (RdgB/HAM1 family)